MDVDPAGIAGVSQWPYLEHPIKVLARHFPGKGLAKPA